MAKISKKQKIKELHKKYKGELSEYIYRWSENLTEEKIDEIFWNEHKPENVETEIIKTITERGEWIMQEYDDKMDVINGQLNGVSQKIATTTNKEDLQIYQQQYMMFMLMKLSIQEEEQIRFLLNIENSLSMGF